jgi:hypothetical protein
VATRATAASKIKQEYGRKGDFWGLENKNRSLSPLLLFDLSVTDVGILSGKVLVFLNTKIAPLLPFFYEAGTPNQSIFCASWQCGNPVCGCPHFHTPSCFEATDAITRGRGRSRAAFYSRLW